MKQPSSKSIQWRTWWCALHSYRWALYSCHCIIHYKKKKNSRNWVFLCPPCFWFTTLWQWSHMPVCCSRDHRDVRVYPYSRCQELSLNGARHLHITPQNKIMDCVSKKCLFSWDDDYTVRKSKKKKTKTKTKQQFTLENNLDPKWVSFSAN